MTKKPIEVAEFQFLKEPALKEVLPAYDNNLVDDKLEYIIGEGETAVTYTIYPAKRAGKPVAIAFETSAKSYGGELKTMIGFDIEKKRLTGVGVTSCSDTPGLGLKVKEPAFRAQFKDIPLDVTVKLKSEGGGIDAITGASISSRAVATAVNTGLDLLRKKGDDIFAKIQK